MIDSGLPLTSATLDQCRCILVLPVQGLTATFTSGMHGIKTVAEKALTTAWCQVSEDRVQEHVQVQLEPA